MKRKSPTRFSPLQLSTPLFLYSFLPWLAGIWPTFFWQASPSAAQAQPPGAVRLIVTRCLTCHAGTEPEGGLDLSSHSAALDGGTSGAAIDIASPMASRLWTQIESNEMPPEDPLSTSEKEIIRQWLLAGAPYPKDALNRFAFTTDRRAGTDWWSFQPLPKLSTDLLTSEAKHHPVDEWIDRALASQGLQQAEPAPARVLVRRLFYDLIGLPPTFEVIQAFERDPSDEAWLELVDQCLSSPHYGERWAQHWLDIVRFGESHGFEYNQPRDHAWHYRDWVIRSLNHDLSYNEFVQMQLAADGLTPDGYEAAAALGFWVAGPHNTVAGVSDAMKETVRQQELEEIASVASQSILGLTIHCARCHDHKFDPIPAEDYYRWIASFSSVGHGVALAPREKDPSALHRQIAMLRHQLVKRTEQLGLSSLIDSSNALWTKLPASANRPGDRYRLEIRISPTVWENPNQATQESDSLWLRLWDSQKNSLADHLLTTPSWITAGQTQEFTTHTIDYWGNGAGNATLWLGPAIANDRFSAAIDHLRIVRSDGKLVFEESFDGLQPTQHSGKQAATQLPVYFNASLSGWNHQGIHALHAVQYQANQWAVQIYAGTSAPIPDSTDSQWNQWRLEIERLEQAAKGLEVFSHIPRPSTPIRVLRRGDVLQPLHEVTPGPIQVIPEGVDSWTLMPLTAQPLSEEALRRFRFAQWITHRDNPLFHRAIVNRVWQHHFGQALTRHPNDLGFQGGQPSHPELIDFLACWFREQSYSLKQLHRLLVTSKAYRQSNQPRDPSTLESDRSNRWLARRDPQRLDAEQLRDSLLATSGLLDPIPYGPPYRDVAIDVIGAAHYYRFDKDWEPSQTRRTIYRWRVRGDRSGLLDSFDCPDPSASIATRTRTTTASQALAMWNEPLVEVASERLAERVERQAVDQREQIRQLWRQVLLRDPTDAELEQAIDLRIRHGLTVVCRLLFNTNEWITVD
jgi:cytochrome c553